jgi:hypothetical protein
MRNVYKVKDRHTGKYANKNKWYGWDETGTTWNRLSHVKLALREGSLRQYNPTDLVVEEYEQEEPTYKRDVTIEELLETKR